MPRLVDSETRTRAVIAAINDVMAEYGIPGLTLRRMAEAARLSPASLSEQYGSRERLLRVIAFRTDHLRCAQFQARASSEGVLAFLPNDEDDVVTARAWLGWCELGRSAEWLTNTMREAMDAERDLLAYVLDHRLSRPDLEILQALIDGLRAAVCQPVRPMSRERAREILQDAATRMLDAAPSGGSGSG